MWGNEDVGNAWYSPFENILQSCPMITMPNKWPEHAIKKLKLQFEMWNSWQLHPFIFQLQKGRRIMSQIPLYTENDAVVFCPKRAATTPRPTTTRESPFSLELGQRARSKAKVSKNHWRKQTLLSSICWFNSASTQNNFSVGPTPLNDLWFIEVTHNLNCFTDPTGIAVQDQDGRTTPHWLGCAVKKALAFCFVCSADW